MQLPLKEINATINVSTTYIDETNKTDWNKQNVIDRNQCTNLENCCFASKYTDQNNWLQLDLNKPYLVYQIRIVGRSDGEINREYRPRSVDEEHILD